VFLAGLGGAGAALGHEALAEAAPSRSPPQMRATGGENAKLNMMNRFLGKST
jgi:hypothetical protein